jgi:hypothetical protein
LPPVADSPLAREGVDIHNTKVSSPGPSARLNACAGVRYSGAGCRVSAWRASELGDSISRRMRIRPRPGFVVIGGWESYNRRAVAEEDRPASRALRGSSLRPSPLACCWCDCSRSRSVQGAGQIARRQLRVSDAGLERSCDLAVCSGDQLGSRASGGFLPAPAAVADHLLASLPRKTTPDVIGGQQNAEGAEAAEEDGAKEKEQLADLPQSLSRNRSHRRDQGRCAPRIDSRIVKAQTVEPPPDRSAAVGGRPVCLTRRSVTRPQARGIYHHLVCIECGNAEPFDDPPLERVIRAGAPSRHAGESDDETCCD